MIPVRQISSPNFDDHEIPVEYVVLHSTGTTLAYTFSIFCDSKSKVSTHLVIGEKGQVYELVKCWEGQALRAWHAGKSSLEVDGKKLGRFNDFSIGIELTNLNGNLHQYTDNQYKALEQVISHLKSVYPVLADPRRIVGHEHIAGWRGKCSPGWQFNWGRFYQVCYPGVSAPWREPAMPVEIREALDVLIRSTSDERKFQAVFWCSLSSFVEKMMGFMKSGRFLGKGEVGQ